MAQGTVHLLCLLLADCPGCGGGTGPTSRSLCSWVCVQEGINREVSCATCQEVLSVKREDSGYQEREAGWGRCLISGGW